MWVIVGRFLSHCCCLANYGDTFSQCLHVVRPTFSFSADLSIGDRVLYTRFNGARFAARVVETAVEVFVHYESCQDVVKVVNMHSYLLCHPKFQKIPQPGESAGRGLA